MHLAEGLDNDLGAGQTREIVHVYALNEFEDELKGHAIHVRHGEHGNDARTGRYLCPQDFNGKLVVAPERAVGNEHTFGVGGGATGVVDHGQSLSVGSRAVVDVLAAEVFGMALAVVFIQALSSFGQGFVAADEQHEIGDVYDTFELRHGFCIECGPHHVAGKEETSVRMVDDVVHLFGLELVKDGDNDGAIGECGQEGHRPVCTVAAADGNFVARHYAGRLK